MTVDEIKAIERLSKYLLRKARNSFTRLHVDQLCDLALDLAVIVKEELTEDEFSSWFLEAFSTGRDRPAPVGTA